MAGRPKGKLQYPSDEPLLRRMARMVATREVSDYRAAARQLAHEAEGPASPQSKAKRLRRGYEARPELPGEVRRLLEEYDDARRRIQREIDAFRLNGASAGLGGIGSIYTVADFERMVRGLSAPSGLLGTGLDRIDSIEAMLREIGTDPIEDAERRARDVLRGILPLSD